MARDIFQVSPKNKFLTNACETATKFYCTRYLLSVIRNDGAEKATRHKELTSFYVALATGCDPDNAMRDMPFLYDYIHDITANKLTDKLDETIGLDSSNYDLDLLTSKFFDAFHTTAMRAISKYETTYSRENQR